MEQNLGRRTKQCCRCVSCGRDVRLNITQGFVVLLWTLVTRGKKPKSRLTGFQTACSELCLRRFRSRDHSYDLQIQPLLRWVGSSAFTSYRCLTSDFWTSSAFRTVELPFMLHVLSTAMGPTLARSPVQVAELLHVAKAALNQ